MKTEKLLLLIETYCADHGLSATAFGKGALGDPKLVPDLREGRELRSATLERVLGFMGIKEAA